MSRTIQISYGTGASGRAKIRYKINSGSWTTINSTTTVTVQSGETITIEAYDFSGASFAYWHCPPQGGDIATNPLTISYDDLVGISAAGLAVTVTTYTITASAGSNGSISPSGSVSVQHGDDQTFTVTADNGYQIKQILVDGSPIPL